MKKLVSISLWALALLVGMCFTACSFHDDVDASLCEYQDTLFIQLNLCFPTSASTRAATPAAGENGDGREEGNSNENAVKNVMVFIFRSADGLNADSSTPFLYKGYFNDTFADWSNSGLETTIKFGVLGYAPLEGDRVIVIANAGPCQNNINNLGELRDYQNYKSWVNGVTIDKSNLFVMSTAYNKDDEGVVHIGTNDGSYEHPYVSTMNIQRTAARIDFMYNDANLSSDELVYSVHENPENLSSKTIATVHVKNIIPVNLMQEPSYLIKRVTSSDDITSEVKYGALETTSSSVPTNYVIEPHTLLKESSVDDAALNSWYNTASVTTRAKTVFASPESYLTGTSISSYLPTTTSTTDLGFEESMILAYTNENTQSKEKQNPDFLTGLLLKAVYEPSAVYTDKDKTLYSPMSDYAKGKTFWRYRPTKALMSEKDCLYFTNEAAAKAYKAEHAEDMAEITEYPGGICYYTIWLRHANIEADPHDTFPMEYGIVRNNIYRVGVEQYTGPGPVLPAYWTPDNMNLRIFVRKWNLRVQPTIRL